MKRVQLKWKWCQGAILKIEDAALGLPFLTWLLLGLSHHPRFECSDQRELEKVFFFYLQISKSDVLVRGTGEASVAKWSKPIKWGSCLLTGGCLLLTVAPNDCVKDFFLWLSSLSFHVRQPLTVTLNWTFSRFVHSLEDQKIHQRFTFWMKTPGPARFSHVILGRGATFVELMDGNNLSSCSQKVEH